MNLVEPIAGKAKAGIWGLDNILSAGFRAAIFFWWRAPGNRQTTVALQFLLEGAKAGENASISRCRRPMREFRDSVNSGRRWQPRIRSPTT